MRHHCRGGLIRALIAAMTLAVAPTLARAAPVAVAVVRLVEPVPSAPATAVYSAYVFRNTIIQLYGYVEYNPDTCALISDGTITTTTAPKHGTVGSTIQNIAIPSGPCTGTVLPFNVTNYTWTDAAKTGTIDQFDTLWTTPDGQYSYPQAYAMTLGPVITASVNQLWWFNGQMPAGYTLMVTFTAQPANLANYVWTVTGGDKFLAFSNNTATITTATNTTTGMGIGASKKMNDVKVTVTVNGNASTPTELTVRAPHSLMFINDVDNADATFGYASQIHYAVLDNFATVLPANVPLNERFTGRVVADFAGTNWRRGPEGGTTVAPANWYDQIQGENLAMMGLVPVPQAPQTPLGAVAVDHWPGEWQIGSATIGAGVRVQTNTWQKYRDHARHTDVTSPP
jgi:hypothetical protein